MCRVTVPMTDRLTETQGTGAPGRLEWAGGVDALVISEIACRQSE